VSSMKSILKGYFTTTFFKMKVRVFRLLVMALFFGMIAKIDLKEWKFDLSDSSPPTYVSVAIIVIFIFIIVIDCVLESRKMNERKQIKMLEFIKDSDLSIELKEKWTEHYLKDY